MLLLPEINYIIIVRFAVSRQFHVELDRGGPLTIGELFWQTFNPRNVLGAVVDCWQLGGSCDTGLAGE